MKRFWKEVSIVPAGEGWQILLDARPIRTPAKRACIVPVKRMAWAIADEWEAQEGEVQPLGMPMTRTAATCLDRVLPDIAEVRSNITSYGGSDLLCYRASRPAGLVERQRRGWNPILRWAAEVLGAELRSTTGVMHKPQKPAALAALKDEVDRLNPWTLTAIADLTTISGSLVLSLAVLHQRLGVSEAWHLSRIDEAWNVAQWGEDDEAAAQAARREADFLHAGAVLDLLRGRV